MEIPHHNENRIKRNLKDIIFGNLTVSLLSEENVCTPSSSQISALNIFFLTLNIKCVAKSKILNHTQPQTGQVSLCTSCAQPFSWHKFSYSITTDTTMAIGHHLLTV